MANPQPRYAEIADYLRSLVADARPGDRLPSDADLADRFDVSRMTARQAVQVLATEQLLHREKGRGTFVSDPPVPRVLGSPLSFTDSTRLRGMAPTSHTISVGAAVADPDDLSALEIPADSKVGVLERLRFADGVPMAIERAVVAPDLREVIESVASGSLHEAFRQAGREPSWARAAVTARLADEHERALLDLDEGGVVLCERRIIFDQNDRPVEHTETRYAAERYVFDVVMHPGEH